MSQRFYANPLLWKLWPNGATGFAPTEGPGNCIGHFAKVQNCPVKGLARPYTCYATGYADTFFSIPAETRVKGKVIKGYITADNEGPQFIPYNGQLEQPA